MNVVVLVIFFLFLSSLEFWRFFNFNASFICSSSKLYGNSNSSNIACISLLTSPFLPNFFIIFISGSSSFQFKISNTTISFLLIFFSLISKIKLSLLELYSISFLLFSSITTPTYFCFFLFIISKTLASLLLIIVHITLSPFNALFIFFIATKKSFSFSSETKYPEPFFVLSIIPMTKFSLFKTYFPGEVSIIFLSPNKSFIDFFIKVSFFCLILLLICL